MGTHQIKTPRGKIYTMKNGNGQLTAKLEWNSGFGPTMSGKFDRKQAFIDNECIRRMNPETPRRTGMLVKSATLGTAIGSGKIQQIAPYARRQYYEHTEKSYWFERMKNRHKDSILKGAQQIE